MAAQKQLYNASPATVYLLFCCSINFTAPLLPGETCARLNGSIDFKESDMNKTTWAAVMLCLSFGAYAEKGGFEAGETPPPQHKEDAGYKGSEDTGQTRVSLIRDFRQGGYVTLEGYIIKKVGDNSYQFRDSSGTVRIDAPAETFKGKTYDATDKIRVSGKVYGKGDSAHLKVARIDEP
jgi:uncharacterized protein (TIGR00156 family)